MWTLILLVVLFVSAVLLINFIVKKRLKLKYYNENPELKATWKYTGGLRQMRKLRIYSTNCRSPLTVKVGFVYLGGLIFYGKVSSNSPFVVIETYLGRGGCDFVFATKTARKCKVELLPENDKSKPDAVFLPHWWQKL